MRERILAAASLIGLVTLSGCFNISVGDIGAGSGGWGHGSKGSYSVVAPFAAGKDTLAGYTGIQLGQFVDGTGGRLPAAFMDRFAAELRGKLSDEKLPSRPDGVTLVLRGTITGYDGEVIAGVEAMDPRTGAVLGAANCIGSTGEMDPQKAMPKRAAGLAKAVAEWLKTGFPKHDD
jgi:hypothetical protein